MSSGSSSISTEMSAMLSMEKQLAATLTEASDEIAHTECLDCEQRAEVYTIIQALKSDTKNHHELVELLTSIKTQKNTGAKSDA